MARFCQGTCSTAQSPHEMLWRKAEFGGRGRAMRGKSPGIWNSFWIFFSIAILDAAEIMYHWTFLQRESLTSTLHLSFGAHNQDRRFRHQILIVCSFEAWTYLWRYDSEDGPTNKDQNLWPSIVSRMSTLRWAIGRTLGHWTLWMLLKRWAKGISADFCSGGLAVGECLVFKE